MDPTDTIVAPATPRVGAAQGILRLSGPEAWSIVQHGFSPALPSASLSFRATAVTGSLRIPAIAREVPATLYLSRCPRSFTGQDVVEVHTLGCPPILDQALSSFIAQGARLATAGEFTLRAFLNGKVDLTEAEAILGLIDAHSAQEAEVALHQMAGGLAHPIQRLRGRLLDLLAELEAGLDFADENLEFIGRTELRDAVSAALGQIVRLDVQMTGRSVSPRCRRAVLIGPPNVGKSSLFNALLGRDAALVSRRPGTTRDYLVGQLALTGDSIELVDTAGIELAIDSISQQAQAAREQAASTADLLLWCVDSRVHAPERTIPQRVRDLGMPVLIVRTKCDLEVHSPTNPQPPTRAAGGSRTRPVCDRGREEPLPAGGASGFGETPTAVATVSSVTAVGLPELIRLIEDWSRGTNDRGLQVVASTAARCRQAIAGSAAALEHAMAAIDSHASDELIAIELRWALDELGQVVGTVYTDDILDRIFSRFCIGK